MILNYTYSILYTHILERYFFVKKKHWIFFEIVENMDRSISSIIN